MLPGIGQVVTRPVRPQDWPALKELLEHTTAPAAMPSDAALAARLSQIDYDREMVFVAERADAPDSRLLAAARLIADPDNLRAELTVIIRSDVDYADICGLLVHHSMAYAQSRQTGELACTISAADYALLHVCRRMGFMIVSATDRPSHAVMRLTKTDFDDSAPCATGLAEPVGT
jgi:acetyltransferase